MGQDRCAVRQHPGPYPGIRAAPIVLVEGIWKPSDLLCLFRTGLPNAEEISLCSTNFPKLRIRETPRPTWGLRRFLSAGSESFLSKNDGECRVPNRAGHQTWFTAAAGGVAARQPAYSQIVEMKEAAIPLILNEISQKRNRPHWFQALNDIAGMTPAPEGSWGQVDEVAAAWLEWGRKYEMQCQAT